MFQLARCLRVRSAQAVSTLNVTNTFLVPAIQSVRPFHLTAVMLSDDWELGESRAPQRNKQVRRDGDWDCPDCGALCFASRRTCFKCDAPNPDPDANPLKYTRSSNTQPNYEAPVDPGGLSGSGVASGTVATWNTMRGFGFISPIDGSDDIFCHVNDIVDGNGLAEGNEVTFDSAYNHAVDKTRAENVAGGVVYEQRQEQQRRPRVHAPQTVDGEPATDPGGLNGSGEMNGTVTNWNASRGFGFISPQDGSGDLFIHVNSINDGNGLEVGSQVTFDSSYDDFKDKYRAENVSGGVVQDRDKARAEAAVFKDKTADWNCPSCGVLCFGSRTACFKCNAPKNDMVDEH